MQFFMWVVIEIMIVRNQGYSIIELTVVILIIGIILAIAVPTMQNYLADCQLQAESMLLQQEIRSVAQESLVKDSGSYYIRLDLPNDKYKIIDPSSNNGYRVVELPDGVDLAFSNFTNHYIFFSPKGKPVVGGCIRLESKKTGKMQYVIVAAITGRTRVSEQPPLSD